MIDLLNVFKKRFPVGQLKEFSRELCEYCLWLIRNKKGRKPRQIDGIQIRKGDEWYARCEELFREAENLVHSGVQRGDMLFDDLKQRSLALADEVFSGPDRGTVFGRIAKMFDSAVRPNKVSQPMSREKSRGKDVDGHWISYPQIDTAKYLALNEIQKFAGWDPPSPENLAKAKESFLKKYPACQDLVQMAESNGKLYHELQASAFQLGFSRDGESVLAEQISRTGIPNCYHARIRAVFERGRAAMTRRQEARAIKQMKGTKKCSRKEQGKQSVQTSQTPTFKMATTPARIISSGIHPNSILNLKPARRWTIVSDETGSVFDNSAFDSKKDAGYYVFVLVPDYAYLPELQRGWHAVNKPLKSLVSTGEDLAKSGCGIIGIPVKGLHPTNRHLWFACIETLLDIVLRILPVDGKTEIVLNVEQRGTSDSRNAGLLAKTADDAMYHLSLVNPEKAKSICLSAKFISKMDCQLNGYADLVAFSRGCGKDTRQVLGKFEWDGPCLISDSYDVVHAFRRCLDLVHQGGVLPVADWNVLVQSRDAQAVGSLIGALLRTVGEEARKDVVLWRQYLDYVMAHLDSKAIRMSVLGPQIAWLKEYEPDAAQLPPRLRLLWLTAQLAASNHIGGTKFGAEAHEREFIELCDQLKDEDAPLTCFAALHLAVEKTDSYEFDVARSILKPWERERIAVPGLRYHAQVLSSLGQHAAFLGDNTKALEYFRKAMDVFKHLSADWQRDFDQTCAYAVIAAMDAGASEMNDLMATYLYGGTYSIETMIDMAQQLSAVGEDEPDSKYAHAILLRYIVTLPSDNPVRNAYVSNSTKWQWSEDGHPWELIAFYRALLLPQDEPARCEWLRKGYKLCANGGPTLRAIAAVLLGALLYDCAATQDEYMAKVKEVISLLPNIGKVRASALLAHADKPIPPLDFAKIVLPFNFR